MLRRRYQQVLVACLLALPFSACAGAECSSGSGHCDGNVAWACNGGGDKGPLKWETTTCGAGTTCENGVCFADPPVACKADRVGTWGCDPSNTYPGQCLAAGYWAWALDRKCATSSGFTCQSGKVVQDGTEVWMAACVLNSTCPPTSSTPLCHNDIVTACTPLGMEGWVRDCAAEGKVCGNGTCTSRN